MLKQTKLFSSSARTQKLAVSINEAYDRVLFKEIERPKVLPTEIVKLMKSEGYTGFRIRDHTELWQKLDGKKPGEGLRARTWRQMVLV